MPELFLPEDADEKDLDNFQEMWYDYTFDYLTHIKASFVSVNPIEERSTVQFRFNNSIIGITKELMILLVEEFNNTEN